MQLNLNADLGESFGAWSMGEDTKLLNIVNSANIACGFHAGDPAVMAKTIELAASAGASIGAHPGFPDLQGFGRRPMAIPENELAALIQYQLAALEGMSKMQGLRMTHVKPHGALNNMACDDRALADMIVKAVKSYDADLIFVAPALSQLAAAAKEACFNLALEIFADRRYTDTGSLVPRRKPGAVIESAQDCISHVRAMIDAGGLMTESGATLPTDFHSICVHGDNPHAIKTAGLLKNALLEQGHELLPLPALIKKN